MMTSASLAASAACGTRGSTTARVTPLRATAEAAVTTDTPDDIEVHESERRARKEARRLAQREALRPIIAGALPPLLGFALFVGLWAFIAQVSPELPAPAKVLVTAFVVVKSPNASAFPSTVTKSVLPLSDMAPTSGVCSYSGFCSPVLPVDSQTATMAIAFTNEK